MKLSNKIHLYSAFLFALLLLLMNLAVYFLFSGLMLKSQMDIARNEGIKTIQSLNDSLGTIPEKNILRAYVPVNGMISIVKEDCSNISVTSQSEQQLKEQKSIFYPGDEESRLEINQRTYLFHSMPLILQDGQVANLQIYKNIEITMGIIRTLRLVLLIVTISVLIPAFLSSRILGKIIINPVTNLIKTMTDIKESGHFKRLPVSSHSKDELYEMGMTFNHMIDLLESNFDKQKQFVSNASHELKTPITVIESYAHLLKRRGRDEAELFEECIEAIHSEAIRMREMTEQLLLLAKPHGQWDIHKEFIMLDELLIETITSFQDAYNTKIHYERISPKMVEVDKQKFRQLLFIFLDNARKYSDEEIVVSVDNYGEKVRIAIQDKGIGIPASQLTKVFDRFYRVDEARGRRIGGSGLGLPLAKELSEAMDIEIILHSEEGVGTSVFLLI